jgi:orotate phosphoribosyltransferase
MENLNSIQKERLISLLREFSYREGDFTLASGKKSSFYLDVKQTSLHPEGANLIGELFLQQAKILFSGAVTHSNASAVKFSDIKAVAGLTLGADPLVTAFSVIAFQKGDSVAALIVRKEPKAHGTSKWVEGKDSLAPGANVLVLEDVTTTGGSSLKAVDRLREEGLNPIGILTVVDREEGASALIREKGLIFGALTTLTEIRASS